MVYGRGILHLSILIETMRREGYELQLGQPKVVIKEIDGYRHEPVELLHVNVDEAFSGKVIEIVTGRKGDILNIEKKDDRVNLEFKITARGLIGLRQPVLTATEGNAVISHRFSGYEPWKGELQRKRNGALIAMETGTSIAYSIDKLQDRGRFFIEPNDPIYAGQVIGEHTKQDDLVVNVIKTKKLTNMRASGSDEKTSIAPAIRFSLEEALEYIGEDEYVEVTPQSIRLRKILLDENERKRVKK
jgi:GTP-binding protein